MSDWNWEQQRIADNTESIKEQLKYLREDQQRAANSGTRLSDYIPKDKLIKFVITTVIALLAIDVLALIGCGIACLLFKFGIIV